jgi:hypothetical protein
MQCRRSQAGRVRHCRHNAYRHPTSAHRSATSPSRRPPLIPLVPPPVRRPSRQADRRSTRCLQNQADRAPRGRSSAASHRRAPRRCASRRQQRLAPRARRRRRWLVATHPSPPADPHEHRSLPYRVGRRAPYPSSAASRHRGWRRCGTVPPSHPLPAATTTPRATMQPHATGRPRCAPRSPVQAFRQRPRPSTRDWRRRGWRTSVPRPQQPRRQDVRWASPPTGASRPSPTPCGRALPWRRSPVGRSSSRPSTSPVRHRAVHTCGCHPRRWRRPCVPTRG